ncbi:hypothetical protein ASG90_01235 [Nocardioides sp. Soil797]|nr:hypothetical protein ASG90_01235 [Nocardioides sp. Soil797]
MTTTNAAEATTSPDSTNSTTGPSGIDRSGIDRSGIEGASGSLISARQAAGVLAEMGVTRASARRALLAGIAGPGVRLRGSLLYDEGRVRTLVRPPLLASEVVEAARAQCFFARIGEGVLSAGNGDLQADDGVERSEVKALQALESGWHMSWVTRPLLAVHVRLLQPMPFIGMVGGFVAIGGEITAVHAGPRDNAGRETAVLTLEEPAAWFQQFLGRHLPMALRAQWTTIDPARHPKAPG